MEETSWRMAIKASAAAMKDRGLFNTIPRPWHNSEKVRIYVIVRVSIETVERVDGGFHVERSFETPERSAPTNGDNPVNAPLSVNDRLW
ncbi:hypothetical protein LR48_Vigan01g106700 [Vigna angularis]|uniref:Uncharacterized protein n=1 Tax=Phaseolus angularis TaxID=3914 RepID=A0A0L9TM52_PHAAN|nr:hypothetical protein LR48_Vigan01g106700 [Vigna angularis]